MSHTKETMASDICSALKELPDDPVSLLVAKMIIAVDSFYQTHGRHQEALEVLRHIIGHFDQDERIMAFVLYYLELNAQSERSWVDILDGLNQNNSDVYSLTGDVDRGHTCDWMKKLFALAAAIAIVTDKNEGIPHACSNYEKLTTKAKEPEKQEHAKWALWAIAIVIVIYAVSMNDYFYGGDG